jgi:phosphoglycolate phosphatase
MNRIILFDLDGTLLATGGAGRRVMNRVFLELYGVRGAFSCIVPDGKTDPAIFREIVRRTMPGCRDEDRVINEVRVRYEHAFEEEMMTSAGAYLMPGVRALLDRLSARSDCALGLLTGNLEKTARIKLRRFDLEGYFPFGAYSSDHEDRPALLPIAIARAEGYLEAPIGIGPHVVVIGDTPLDVHCALTHGATAVGVAHARFTASELVAAGAHLTLEGFDDTASVIAALGFANP